MLPHEEDLLFKEFSFWAVHITSISHSDSSDLLQARSKLSSPSTRAYVVMCTCGFTIKHISCNIEYNMRPRARCIYIQYSTHGVLYIIINDTSFISGSLEQLN